MVTTPGISKTQACCSDVFGSLEMCRNNTIMLFNVKKTLVETKEAR